MIDTRELKVRVKVKEFREVVVADCGVHCFILKILWPYHRMLFLLRWHDTENGEGLGKSGPQVGTAGCGLGGTLLR